MARRYVPYKEQVSFDNRLAESTRVRSKFGRVAVIVQPGAGAEHLAITTEAKKRKYLVPLDLTVGQFVYMLRKRFSMPATQALFVYIENTLPPTADLMGVLDARHRDEDGFLYLTYMLENTFG